MAGLDNAVTGSVQPAEGEPPGLCASTMAQALLRTIEWRGDAMALRTSDGATEIRYDQLLERLRAVAATLSAHGVSRGDTVGLMLTNRPEFHLIDAAAMLMGAVGFSMDNSASPEELAYVIRDAGARIVFAEPQFVATVEAANHHSHGHLDYLKKVGDPATDTPFTGGSGDFDLEAAAAAVQPDDLLTLIYTSGTTGPPKGVQLTHGNMIEMLRSVHAAWRPKSGGQVVSYLPHAHVADRWFSHYSGLMMYGATITDVAVLADLIPTTIQVRPTFWGGVPRVWEKLKSALQAGTFGPLDDPVRVREVLGFDRCELFVVGAGPTTREVLEFFNGLGIEICEAWGMIETSGIGTVNRSGEPTRGPTT